MKRRIRTLSTSNRFREFRFAVLESRLLWLPESKIGNRKSKMSLGPSRGRSTLPSIGHGPSSTAADYLPAVLDATLAALRVQPAFRPCRFSSCLQLLDREKVDGQVFWGGERACTRMGNIGPGDRQKRGNSCLTCCALIRRLFLPMVVRIFSALGGSVPLDFQIRHAAPNFTGEDGVGGLFGIVFHAGGLAGKKRRGGG